MTVMFYLVSVDQDGRPRKGGGGEGCKGGCEIMIPETLTDLTLKVVVVMLL